MSFSTTSSISNKRRRCVAPIMLLITLPSAQSRTTSYYCSPSSFVPTPTYRDQITYLVGTNDHPHPHIRTRSRTSKHRRPDLTMKIKAALVGLPNVGKSTLFNALSQTPHLAPAKNFPFCTIEPNIAPLPIPSPHLFVVDGKPGDEPSLLTALTKLSKTPNQRPGTISLVDVAGLVRGSSRGEGLGNRFLATVRECDVVVHVVRSHRDGNVVHVHGKVDEVEDAEVVNLELVLADLSHVERRLEKGASCAGMEREALMKAREGLKGGLPARSIGLTVEEEKSIKSMGLLTLKPVIYAFNVDEVDFTVNRSEASEKIEGYMRQIQYCDLDKDRCVLVSAKLESELAELSLLEREEYLRDLGVEFDGIELCHYTLPLLLKEQLGLSLVYTGPGVPAERTQTTKMHVVRSSEMSALDFAGKLHKEIRDGFMFAEVTNCFDLIRFESYGAAKEAGVVRMEGRDYMIQDGDVVLMKWKR
ncbi:hypothetical protein ACHAXS_013244 [Conticribra weissflogii]